MSEFALGRDELLPGLTQELLDSSKAEVLKAVKPYVGREIDEDTRASMERQVAGALFRMRRRVGLAPLPTWLSVGVGETPEVVTLHVNYDKLPRNWDPAKVRAALGIEI